MAPTQNNRNVELDLMKGLGMLAVILAHSKVPMLAHDFLYSFHMPLFFVVGGYLYKSRPVNVTWIKHNLKRLITPYVFFFVLPYLLLMQSEI